MLNSEFPRDLLERVIERARRAPSYSKRFDAMSRLTDESDWRKLPLTRKEDLRLAYPFGLLAVPNRELHSYHESSGTSGQAISSFFTAQDWEDVVSRFSRSSVGLTSDDRVLIKTPYSLVTTAHQMHGASARAGATIVPADNRSSNMPYSRVLRLLQDLPITVAWCMPTEALIWAHLARREGLDPAKDFPSLRAFWVAGEALSPAKRQAISQVWGGKRVVEDYGSTETGSLAGECERGALHLWTDRVYCELEEGGLQGEGSLVVTPLFREGMPLVRYALGDRVRMSRADCACGWALPTVEVLGRRASEISLGHLRVFPRELEQAVYEAGANSGLWFWRARPLGGSIQVEIHAESSEQAEKSIARLLLARFGVAADVRSVPASRFLPVSALSPERQMQKPQFVFSAEEDWDRSLVYA